MIECKDKSVVGIGGATVGGHDGVSDGMTLEQCLV